MDGRPRWLSAREEQLWRDFQLVQARIHRAIQLDLRSAPEAALRLSEPEYEVLVHLTDLEEPLRMGELARLLSWEQSRVSHLVARMCQRGLLHRSGCPSDRRGFLIEPSELGLRAIRAAAPGHVETARRELFDRLDAAELEGLGRALRRLASVAPSLADEPAS